jgi:hypothetical protein
MSDGTPTKPRIWHASRDAYHCAFRILRLLTDAPSRRLELVRLRALDLLLLYPSLLYRVSMPREMKAKFRVLNITTPEQLFVRLPGNAAIFQDLRIYQSAGLTHLAAKNILSREALERRTAELIHVPPEISDAIGARNFEQRDLMAFLLSEIGALPLEGIQGLYRRAALPESL